MNKVHKKVKLVKKMQFLHSLEAVLQTLSKGVGPTHETHHGAHLLL